MFSASLTYKARCSTVRNSAWWIPNCLRWHRRSGVESSGQLRAGARKVSMGLLVNTLAQMGDLDRPVVDRTGLSGTYDFVFEWAPQHNTVAAPGLDAQVDDPGPTFVEDLKKSLD